MMDICQCMELSRQWLVKEKTITLISEVEEILRQVHKRISPYTFFRVGLIVSGKLKTNSCSGKLDFTYLFWNTTVNAEKQLLDWMNSFSTNNSCISTTLNTHESLILKDEEDTVKKEEPTPNNIELSTDESFDLSITSDSGDEEGEAKVQNEAEGSFLSKNKYYDEDEVKNDSQEKEIVPTEFVDVSLLSNEAGPSFPMDGENGSLNQQGIPSRQCLNKEIDNSRMDSESKNSPDAFIGCQICGKLFKTNFWFDKHMQSHADNKQFTCDLCGKSFKLNSVLRSHQREIHSTVKRYACESCDYATNNKTNYEWHVKIKHMDVNIYGTKCDLCDFKFFRVEDIMRHKIKEHNAPRFHCTVCNKSYTSKQYLNIHQAIHKPNFKPEHQCVECGKMFPNVGHLSSHIRSRHLGLRFDCKECGKSVSSRSSLRDHMNIHTGTKPHICNICNKSFGAQKYLRIHLRSHTGEKPYTCQHCNKSFTQRGSLTIHERYHSGDRPYKCLHCLKGFVAHSLLKSHMKSHKIT